MFFLKRARTLLATPCLILASVLMAAMPAAAQDVPQAAGDSQVVEPQAPASGAANQSTADTANADTTADSAPSAGAASSQSNDAQPASETASAPAAGEVTAPAPAPTPAPEAGTAGAAGGDSPQLLPTIPVAVPTDQKQPAKAAETAEASPPNIDEIVITAQKREERLQKVPIAVTVVNSDQLRQQNITQVTDLSRAVPAVEMSGEEGNADARISIRGISTNSFSVTAEQAVSYVADGVVLGKAPSVSLFDIAQVEVLRGPQGTLFGKNSSAGVISVITNKPDPTKFEVIGHTDFGKEYNARVLQGTVNIPIMDNTAIRVSAGEISQRGLIHNVVRDEDSVLKIRGGRARLLWEPTSDLTFNVIGDYEKQHVTEQLYLLFNRYVNSSGQPQAIPGCKGTVPSRDSRVSCNNDPTYNDATTYGLSGQMDWQIGDYTLTSITSARNYKQDTAIDVDGLPGNYYNNGNTFDNRVYTQELRIASPVGETVEYVTGLYWSRSHVPNFLTQIIGADALLSLNTGEVPISLCGTLGICANGVVGLNNPNQYTADLKSSALFGQMTVHVLDDLKLTLGARWTRDDIKMVSTSYIGLASSLLPGLAGSTSLIPLNAPLEGHSKVNNISWRAGLQYDLSKSSMAYLTASHGYKGPQVVFVPPGLIPGLSGAQVTLPTPASINIVKPEYPMDYEAGIKSSFFGGLLATNINVFHTTIKDFQSSIFTKQAVSSPNNIPQVVTKGIELDLFGYLAKGLIVNGGILLNSVTYPRGYMVPCTQVGPKCPPPSSNPLAPKELLEDIGGEQLTGAPKFKFLLAPEYEHEITSSVNGFIGGDIVYRTKIRYMPSDDTRTETPDRAIVGLRLGVRGPDRNWGVAVFARNLFNKPNAPFLFAPYLLSGLTAPGIDTSGQAITSESFRFFGLSLDAKF